ncbi:hypothetical protein L2E82_24986 [Cichorium intybus]|uniref:Uncharacterized protein n=1 Tax=Cichorium intybus TaxID=13427 RepID=A0ACB9E2Z8_CICIN|nr:hypothetical protein L2E82_24986 [Cichorium intybus]
MLHTTHQVKADVSDPIQVKALFDAAESAFNSPLYILVNVAGVLDSSYSTIPNYSLDEFDRTFAVNTRGAYLCCKEAANRFKQGGGGRIQDHHCHLIGYALMIYEWICLSSFKDLQALSLSIIEGFLESLSCMSGIEQDEAHSHTLLLPIN